MQHLKGNPVGKEIASKYFTTSQNDKWSLTLEAKINPIFQSQKIALDARSTCRDFLLLFFTFQITLIPLLKALNNLPEILTKREFILN